MDFLSVLKDLAVLNYDNGQVFTNRDRLDAIAELLKGSDYRRVNRDGLFELYAPGGILPDQALLISTHVDCVDAITRCFAEEAEHDTLRGTFDNLITNACAVYLMITRQLSRNTIVAFTGDEEEDSRGAAALTQYLRQRNVSFKTIVLDVTDMGWDEGAFFTIENNFWGNQWGEAVIRAAKAAGERWRFVPSDEEDIPCYVPGEKLIPEEAECDESWEYDEQDVECFSLCIPVRGHMHSNSGVFARKASIDGYLRFLRDLSGPRDECFFVQEVLL